MKDRDTGENPIFGAFTPRVWLTISTVMSIAGYSSLFFIKFIPVQYITICQIFCGIIAGMGGGIGMTLIVITPQTWLDKTRSKYSPFVFAGASLMSLIALPFGTCKNIIPSGT